MNLHNLKPAPGATHNTKRLGRGQGSGKGGTSTRGTKGAQARAGYEHKVGFEGGQMLSRGVFRSSDSTTRTGLSTRP